MSSTTLCEDEFRVLAYIRAYADSREQHLDPGWVQEQLSLSLPRMRKASRKLAALGLAEFFEWEPPESLLRMNPEMEPGPLAMDICLTERGWNYLTANPRDNE
jgi:hypothetical protein